MGSGGISAPHLRTTPDYSGYSHDRPYGRHSLPSSVFYGFLMYALTTTYNVHINLVVNPGIS